MEKFSEIPQNLLQIILKSNLKYYIINNKVSLNSIINKLKYRFNLLFSKNNTKPSILINKINYLLQQTYLLKFPKSTLKNIIKYYINKTDPKLQLSYNKLLNLFNIYSLNNLLKPKIIYLIKKKKMITY